MDILHDATWTRCVNGETPRNLDDLSVQAFREPKQHYTFSSPTCFNEQQMIGFFKHVPPISIQQTDHSKAHLPQPFGSRRGLLDLRTVSVVRSMGACDFPQTETKTKCQ